MTDPLNRAVIAALKDVYDPEVGLDLVTMGLIYGLTITPEELRVALTLTSRGCPLGASITSMANEALEAVADGRRVALSLVWEPPWNPRMITAEGREALML